MPTAIRDLDLSSLPTSVDDLDGYERCMVVCRWGRRVVGRLMTPVKKGALHTHEIASCLTDDIRRAIATAWVESETQYDVRALPGATPPSATVAVCTHDRPEDLERALTGISGLAHHGHEVLVVDNAPSSAAARRIVDRFPSVRYVCEPRIGLNTARNCALREARGDVVAFIDDDAVPDPEWLDELLVNFDDPEVMCSTGLTLPLELETEAQELFESQCSFARGFERRVFDGQRDNPLAVGMVGAGVNMALRRDVYRLVGGFDERLDAGTPTRSGGDHEMFVRILTEGYRIAYDPKAVNWHRHRRTRTELLETVYGYGVGVYGMWTGLLLEHGEIGVFKRAWMWFRCDHLPVLLGGPQTADRRAIVRAELRGCLNGGGSWLRARRLRPKEARR